MFSCSLCLFLIPMIAYLWTRTTCSLPVFLVCMWFLANLSFVLKVRNCDLHCASVNIFSSLTIRSIWMKLHRKHPLNVLSKIPSISFHPSRFLAWLFEEYESYYSHLCVGVATLVKVLHARIFLTNHRCYCFKTSYTYWTSSNVIAGQVPKLYIRFWHNYALFFI